MLATTTAEHTNNSREHLGAWFDLSNDGVVLLKTGKVELGQGILLALRQIAAEELGLPLEAIETISGDTALSPLEGGTFGSMSVESSAPLVRQAAAELRDHMFEVAAMRLQAPRPAIGARDGQFLLDGATTSETYWTARVDLRMDRAVTGMAAPKPVAQYGIVGTSPRSTVTIERLSAGAYIHDTRLNGMLHGRVLHKPHSEARLEHADVGRVENLSGVVRVTRERDFIGLIAKDEYALVAAMPKLESCCHWSRPESDQSQSAQDLLTQQRSVDTVIRADAGAFRDDADPGVLTATYTKPLIGHGSIGPSCAIACVAQHNGQSTVDVLTHSQNVFALRDQIARVLQIPADSVRVRHRLGAGCYGHNGADDAAMDAVLLARSVPGEPVRVQWSRKDELTSEPLGSPMRVEIAATLHGSRISSWRLVTRSGTHIARPGWNNGVNLLSPAAISEAFAFGTTVDLPAHNGGSKNAVALYDFPQHVTYEFVPTMPFRLSALRSLGAFANVFAIESFMDELAKAAGADPIDFRLAHLSDDRARRVIQRVADLAHWSDPRPSGCGRGLGFARFKNTGTYCAVIVEVLVEEVVELRRMLAVVDAGLAINPAGIIAQIEGGMLQAASWALKEEIPTRGGAVIAEGWRDYPILRFNEVPEISIEVVSASEYDSTGVGEASLGPTAGAIGNAVANALDIRVRDLPFTRDRIIAAMMAEA